MLKLGTQNIAALHLGGAGIQKAYLGEAVVFGAGKPSRLPEGYTEVEYIESTGTQYIDTGVKPASTIKFVIDAEPLTKPTSVLDALEFAQSQYAPSSGTKFFFILRYSSSGVEISPATVSGSVTYRSISTNTTPRRMTITVDYPNKKAFIAKESEIALTNVSVSSNMGSILMIRGRQSFSKVDIGAKIYSCQIEIDGVVIRNFVPCIAPTNAVGLYDLVEGKFYGNAGTGAFTAGPAV